MPKDKRFGKKWRMRDRYFGRYHEHPGVLVPGLKACRWAAALSERDLAELVDTSQTTINNLQRPIRINRKGEPQGFKADALMLERLCQALKVWPEDLTYYSAVEDATPQDGAEQRPASASDEERAERRREVNRIKGDWALRYSSSAINLGGLKARRLEVGLSEEGLARMIGTNLTTIRELEKKYGGRSAYAKTVRKLCQVLEVRPADLICWIPSSKDSLLSYLWVMVSASGQSVIRWKRSHLRTAGAMYRPLVKSLLQISAVVGQESRIIISAGSKTPFDTVLTR